MIHTLLLGNKASKHFNITFFSIKMLQKNILIIYGKETLKNFLQQDGDINDCKALLEKGNSDLDTLIQYDNLQYLLCVMEYYALHKTPLLIGCDKLVV